MGLLAAAGVEKDSVLVGLLVTGCDKTCLTTLNFIYPILLLDDTCTVEARTFFEWSGIASC